MRKGQEASPEAQNVSEKCYQPHNLSCVAFYLLTEESKSVRGVRQGLRNTSFIWGGGGTTSVKVFLATCCCD